MSVYIKGMEMPTSQVLFCIHPDGKVFADLEGGWREYKAIPVPKPKTNADRIRAMTDEELAQWLCCHITECSRCEGRNYAGHECEFINGRSTGLTMWLKSPVIDKEE